MKNAGKEVKSRVKVVEREVVFLKDGEEPTTRKTVDTTAVTMSSEPPFVKLYLDAVIRLKDLPAGYTGILGELLKMLPWANEEQDFPINAALKRKIAKKLGLSTDYIAHSLSRFINKGILARTDVGMYMFNPNIFGRGEWKDIRELRLNVRFNKDGVQFACEVEKHGDPIAKG